MELWFGRSRRVCQGAAGVAEAGNWAEAYCVWSRFSEHHTEEADSEPLPGQKHRPCEVVPALQLLIV